MRIARLCQSRIRPFDRFSLKPYNNRRTATTSDEGPPQWSPVNLVRVEIQQP